MYSVIITAQEVSKAFLFQAGDLLNKAVARDPEFVSAYCQLAKAHGRIDAFDIDHSRARRDLAEAAVRNAERLAPDDGETHLARARFLLDCDLNFKAARKELAAGAFVAERLGALPPGWLHCPTPRTLGRIAQQFGEGNTT
ncbi:MAG: hypothetical protein WCE51_06305 [Chthoniobacterales bacterium]